MKNLKVVDLLSKLKKGINEFAYILDFNKIKSTRHDYIILCHDDHRQINRNNQRYSPLTDSIFEELKIEGKSVISYNLPYSKLTGQISYGDPKSINGEYSRARLRQFLSNLLSLLLFRRKNSDRFYIMMFWIKIITKHQSIKVVCVQPSEDLCKAGKLLSVEIIDVQHGLIDYNKYYDARDRSLYQKNGIPDTVYCWDEQSKKRIENSWPQTNALLYGHPFINRIKKEGAAFIDDDGGEKLRTLLRSQSILITLQYAEEGLNTILIPNFIMGVIRKCLSQRIVVAIKLHPLQVRHMGLLAIHDCLKKIFPQQMGGIIDVSNIPIAIILNNVNFHITEYSASVIEASILGVNSGIWCKDEQIEEYFLPYIADGSICKLQQDENVIMSVIKHELSKYA